VTLTLPPAPCQLTQEYSISSSVAQLVLDGSRRSSPVSLRAPSTGRFWNMYYVAFTAKVWSFAADDDAHQMTCYELPGSSSIAAKNHVRWIRPPCCPLSSGPPYHTASLCSSLSPPARQALACTPSFPPQNIRFLGGTASSYGGAMQMSYGTLTLLGCEFSGARSLLTSTAQMYRPTTGGGAVYAQSASVNITNCLFSSCISGTVGGAIKAQGGTLSVKNTRFTNNTALMEGGAVTAYNAGQYNFTGCTFSGNRARNGTNAYGGAVFIAYMVSGRMRSYSRAGS
jgi:hypothetical protein